MYHVSIDTSICVWTREELRVCVVSLKWVDSEAGLILEFDVVFSAHFHCTQNVKNHAILRAYSKTHFFETLDKSEIRLSTQGKVISSTHNRLLFSSLSKELQANSFNIWHYTMSNNLLNRFLTVVLHLNHLLKIHHFHIPMLMQAWVQKKVVVNGHCISNHYSDNLLLFLLLSPVYCKLYYKHYISFTLLHHPLARYKFLQVSSRHRIMCAWGTWLCWSSSESKTSFGRSNKGKTPIGTRNLPCTIA